MDDKPSVPRPLHPSATPQQQANNMRAWQEYYKYYGLPMQQLPGHLAQMDAQAPTQTQAQSLPWQKSSTPLQPSKQTHGIKVISGIQMPSRQSQVKEVAPSYISNNRVSFNDRNTWPFGLNEYMRRGFESCRSESERQEMESKLLAEIKAVFDNGKVYSENWNLKELPFILRRSEKKAQPILSNEEATKLEKKRERENRFKAKKQKKATAAEQHSISEVRDWDKDTIIGTSKSLEKKYLRLTSAPDPSTVRPLPILKKVLDRLKRKWKEEGDYDYICDQFKSLRQDLTVQRIKNEFTVHVYEIHARIALEQNDLGEYNQCQTQLRDLYEYGIEGNPMEFLAYRILYLLHTGNQSELTNLLSSLEPNEKQDASVHHALSIRKALLTNNYYSFFKLYIETPKLGGYLIDCFIEKTRLSTLRSICKAYRPTVSVDYVAKLFCMNKEDCLMFLKEYCLIEGDLIDCKSSMR